MQWLVALWENGLSGILADEMGLGKTIQIIALIAYLREHNTPGPYLIAAPLATLPNWIKEFEKWLPSCPIILYHGTKQEREAIRLQHLPPHKSKDMSFPIVVTSFEICMIDRAYLERYLWQYLILDEGHRIKNKDCKLLRSLKSFKSCSRLLLSGTPIQNTLEELWSLLNFVSPMIFDDLRIFKSWFGFKNIGIDLQVEDIVDTEYSNRIVSKLHEILRPFLLRRLKKDIFIDIPPKREIIVYCKKTAVQEEYYAHTLNNSLREALQSMGITEQIKAVSEINMTMNLRKICNHPFLFGEPKDPKSGKYLSDLNPEYLVQCSGKLQVLDRILAKLKADKKTSHKVLVFSQMTKFMDILEDYAQLRGKRPISELMLLMLTWMAPTGYRYVRFDGSTKIQERQIAIEEFNRDPDVFLFFISTRAGGLGINLTAADTVILADSDYNPHQDSQAQDRCHRIGQSKPVVIYRLITIYSIEINMLEKQVSKKKLERLTIHGGDYRQAGRRLSSNLTITKLRQLLQDDVKNLRHRQDLPTIAAAAAEEVEDEDSITDQELDMILNRELLFSGSDDQDSQEKMVPVEGRMYDLVHSEAIDILQAVN
jgi:ATP-dependent DNA helicase